MDTCLNYRRLKYCSALNNLFFNKIYLFLKLIEKNYLREAPKNIFFIFFSLNVIMNIENGDHEFLNLDIYAPKIMGEGGNYP